MTTLPSLSVLHVSVRTDKATGQLKYPLSTLFDNLHLPGLRSLSLDSKAKTWRNSRAIITEVHAALHSAPCIMKLTLGGWFLGGQALNVDVYLVGLKPIQRDVNLLCMHAPELEHLYFPVHSPLRRHGVFPFVERVFASTRWMNLKSRMNTVRKITLVASCVWRPEDTVAENADRSGLVAEIRRYVRRKVTVVFLEPEDEHNIEHNIWGW